MIGRLARLGVLRRTPYGRVLDIGWLVLRRVREDLPPGERARLAQILRMNARNPRAIGERDREELRGILSHVDVKRIAREAAMDQAPFRRGSRRWR